jgi:putative glutamine amidotransferase
MRDSRPAIGICTSLTEAAWSVWNQRAALLPYGYVAAVQRAGAMALLIPPDPVLVDEPDQALDRIDGLILAGGHDVDPASYGAEAHPETNGIVVERDYVELALARRAVERDMPVLGICRGMQLLNVAFGGTLRQHLPDELGHEEHRRVPGSFDGSDHDVRLKSGSLAALAAGEDLHRTKSHHHQGVERIGEGFEVTGFATLDDLPEAIEAPARRFVLGVQWHPEADERSRVIAALVDQARAGLVDQAPAALVDQAPAGLVDQDRGYTSSLGSE